MGAMRVPSPSSSIPSTMLASPAHRKDTCTGIKERRREGGAHGVQAIAALPQPTLMLAVVMGDGAATSFFVCSAAATTASDAATYAVPIPMCCNPPFPCP